MTVGACRIRLRFPESQSLKGKRHGLKSLAARVRNRFNVSVAEIGENDKWQVATLGICCVSNHADHANEVLSRVVSFVEGNRGDLELLDYEIELLHAL